MLVPQKSLKQFITSKLKIGKLKNIRNARCKFTNISEIP